MVSEVWDCNGKALSKQLSCCVEGHPTQVWHLELLGGYHLGAYPCFMPVAMALWESDTNTIVSAPAVTPPAPGTHFNHTFQVPEDP